MRLRKRDHNFEDSLWPTEETAPHRVHATLPEVEAVDKTSGSHPEPAMQKQKQAQVLEAAVFFSPT